MTQLKLAPEKHTAPSAPSLVTSTRNSSKSPDSRPIKPHFCPNVRVLRGVCTKHSYVRHLTIPCKNRSCPTCGPFGRYRIATRIAYGVEKLWPCAWMVLTFREDITKKLAVRRLSAFVKQLRRPLPDLQYAATFELTKAGRLHINLICGSWEWINQQSLEQIWGARLWVEWVQASQPVGLETAKAYSPEALGNYLSKLEQAVPSDRRCSFSRSWPKLPGAEVVSNPRVEWTPLDYFETLDFYHQLGHSDYAFLSDGTFVWQPPSWQTLTLCTCFGSDPDPPVILLDQPLPLS